MNPSEIEPVLREFYSPVRIEVISSPGIPPTPNAVSIKFSSADEFKAALAPDFKAKPVGNGEVIQVYLKSFRTPQGVRYCADFASDPASPVSPGRGPTPEPAENDHSESPGA